MTSYSEEYKECPECHCQYEIWYLTSCNTIGAKVYTDGYIDGPMYDDGGRIVKCPACGVIKWDEDIPIIPYPVKGFDIKSVDELPKDRPAEFYEEFFKAYYESRSKLGEELGDLPLASFVRGQQYEDILLKRFWNTPEQEKYVRIRAWWSINNAYRDNVQKYTASLHKHEENLQALLELLNPDIPDLDPDCSAFHLEDLGEPIMRAEVLRELGKFDECVKLLDQISASTNSELPPVQTIKELAISKNKRVGLIN